VLAETVEGLAVIDSDAIGSLGIVFVAVIETVALGGGEVIEPITQAAGVYVVVCVVAVMSQYITYWLAKTFVIVTQAGLMEELEKIAISSGFISQWWRVAVKQSEQSSKLRIQH
jgi:hypothetical protein